MEIAIAVLPGDSLESIVNILSVAKDRNEHAFCIFNGHRLESDNITMDLAFKEVMGCSKEEFDKKIEISK